jgi:hypothetical protein
MGREREEEGKTAKNVGILDTVLHEKTRVACSLCVVCYYVEYAMAAVAREGERERGRGKEKVTGSPSFLLLGFPEALVLRIKIAICVDFMHRLKLLLVSPRERERERETAERKKMCSPHFFFSPFLLGFLCSASAASTDDKQFPFLRRKLLV